MGSVSGRDDKTALLFSRRAALGSLGAVALTGCVVTTDRIRSVRRTLEGIVPEAPTIDVHAHLVPPAWFGAAPRPAPSYSREELAAQIARFPYIPIGDPTELVDREYDRLMRFEAARFDGTIETSTAFLISEMDAAGIDVAVNNCLDEFSQPYGRVYSVPVERTLEDIARMAEAHPGRLVNFFGVDPHRGAAGLTLMRRAVTEFGCCGMGEWLTDQWKILPSDREIAYPFLALCEELKIPFGNNGSGSKPSQTPTVFEQILKDFPKLKVVHQAAGLLTDEERAAAPEEADLPYRLLALAERYENFWLDVDDWQRRDDEGKTRLFRFLRRAFDGPAANRIMFGTDFPVFTRPVSAAYYVDSILNDSARLGVELRDGELARFFSTNALSLLDGPYAPRFIRDAAAHFA